jgi:3',5'-cyclic AMP phosphodiesterase CpdA
MKPVFSSRRDVLRQAGLAAATLAAGSRLGAAVAAPDTAAGRKRALRIAHLTDIHVKPEAGAPEGMTACLHHAQEHHRPDLVINTGDAIWDSMAAEESQVRSLWELSLKIWKSECGVPVEHAIGNHDIWGVNKAKSRTTGTEPLYHKKWILSLHGWERPYRSFDRAGWHFVALDTVIPKEGAYQGRLDEEQFEWLKEDLGRVPATTPVLLFGHIPVLSAAAFFKAQSEKTGDWQVPGSVMMIDARHLKDLLHRHPNVKACLSGHLHLADRVDYLGVSYICGGSVSGGWWRGDNQECPPGYGVIDLYADGTLENRYVPYGWKART